MDQVMLRRSTALLQRFIEESSYVSTPASTVLGPVGVPIGTVRALGAPILATPDHLSAQTHICRFGWVDDSGALQLGAGQDLKPSQTMLIKFSDRVEQIAVEGHATWTGAKSRVTVRRSVRVHPCGGVMRSA